MILWPVSRSAPTDNTVASFTWAEDIERPFADTQEEGYAARTISVYRSTIRQIMQRAVGRVLPANPADLAQFTAPGQRAEQRRPGADEVAGTAEI